MNKTVVALKKANVSYKKARGKEKENNFLFFTTIEEFARFSSETLRP